VCTGLLIRFERVEIRRRGHFFLGYLHGLSATAPVKLR
jgi:hypothetical protein